MLELFLSWSGEKSRAVALALRDWLPAVIHDIEPFVSANDIYAGTRWQIEIASRLETAKFGIVCVTIDNQSSTWLNFEAGALAKAVDSSRVVPLAIDLKPSDIQIPLGQFQAQPATQQGISRILASINAVCDPGLSDSLLARTIAMWWPQLQESLDIIEGQAGDTSPNLTPTRSERELLEEMLDAVRSLAARQDAYPPAGPGAATSFRALTDIGAITIDTSEFVGRPQRHRLGVASTTTVGDLLNSTYLMIRTSVGPFTYGTAWILCNTDGACLDQLDSPWARGGALSENTDARLLREVGVGPGITLLARRLTEFGEAAVAGLV